MTDNTYRDGSPESPRVVDPDSTSATEIGLLKGILGALFGGGSYETVAASQTDQKLGVTGGAGDVVTGLLIVPATSAAGVVTIQDGTGSDISIFAGGGTTALQDLRPFFVPLGMVAATDWRVTTGANVSVIAFGKFT